MDKNILEIRNLKVQFSKHNEVIKAVDDITISVKEGITLGIVGESGSGKSIMSLAVLGLLPNRAKIVGGSIIFNGRDITNLSENELRLIRGNDIAMIFQDHMASLNPVISVGKQIEEAIILHQKLSRKEAKNKTIEMLKLVKISNPEKRYSEYPYEMSGGMRQRVMIAMAICCTPKLLICDEPTTALDVTTQAQVLNLINNLKEKMGTTVIMITHDLGVIAEMADDVVVMYAGKMMEHAKVKELFKNPMHPYTFGLLKSIPKLELEEEKLYGIKGSAPSLADKILGCPFFPRCDVSREICSQKFPDTLNIDGHIVNCWDCIKKREK